MASPSLYLLGLLLVGGPDEDEPAVGAGDGAADQEQVVLGIDADDGQVASGDLGVAVLAGHANATLRSTAAAVGGVA